MTRTVLAALGALLLAAPASAHVVLEIGQANAGSFHKATFGVGHGCEGSLLDEHFDQFAMNMRLPETPDTTLYFPVVQECEKGAHRWIEIPEAGKASRDYREPAPALRLLPAAPRH